MNRPALQLVAFTTTSSPKRLQVFGKSEMTFLKAMKLEDRRRVFDNLLRCEIPASSSPGTWRSSPSCWRLPGSTAARCYVPS